MEMPVHHSDWILIILLVSVALVLAARLYNPERFAGFILLPFHVKRKEMELSFNPVVARGLFDVSLSVVSYLVLALAVFVWLHRVDGEGVPDFSNSAIYFRILLILVLFYLFKNLAGLSVGWVFDQTEEIAKSQNAQLSHRAWLALALIPLLSLSVFNLNHYDIWWWLTSVLTLAGLIMSLYFSFLQLWRIGVSSYYKIIYLCALEITPLIFLVGWLKSLD